MHPLFSHEWALALGAALESSAMYREAARRWDGAVCLQRTADASTALPSAAVFLDLKHGHCHAARLATEADLKQAKFVISGPLTAWRSVLRGNEAPTVALMRGHLTLSKGMLPMLLPHVGAANALVDVVRTISPLTDDGARVDFDASEKTRDMRGKAPQPFEAMRPKPMRRAVQDDGMQAGVAGDDLPGAASCRVAVQNALDIRADFGKHDG